MEMNQMKSEIIDKWKNVFHQKVPDTDDSSMQGMVNHLPELIQELVTNDNPEEFNEIVKLTTRDQLKQGNSSLEFLITEYQVLRDVILDTLEKGGISQTHNKNALTQAILSGMLSAAMEYSKFQGEDKARLESTLNHLPVGVVIMEKQSFNVLFVNEAGHKLAGGYYPVHPGEHERSDCFATDALGTRLKMQDMPMYRAAFGEKLKAYELTWHTPHGNQTVVMHSDVLPSVAGEPERVLIVFQEIQERKNREDFMREENQLRERFVASLSHDLKTPLCVARMNVELIANIADEKIKGRAQSAIIQIDRIDRMLKDLLDTNRLKAGKPLPIEIEDLNLSSVADETISAMATLHGNRFQKDYPEVIQGCWCGKALRRVLDNLLSNAVKYGSKNSPIIISMRQASEWISLEVQNEGPKITADDKERIFLPFVRSDNKHSVKKGGWGIGLSICKALIEAHDGEIEVESNDARTVFRVWLPKKSKEELLSQ